MGQSQVGLKPWHVDGCRCLFEPQSLGQYGDLHCTACDNLYRGSVWLCPTHKAAPDLLASLKETLRALESHLDEDTVHNKLKHREILCPCNSEEVARAKAAIQKAGVQ